MNYILDQDVMEMIEANLAEGLTPLGVHCVFLSDMAGHVVASKNIGKSHHDIYALAALSVANFRATNEIARLIGEQDFTLLFHKGNRENIHFSRVGEDFLLCTIFGQETSLGFVRLKVAELGAKLLNLIEGRIIKESST
jgi:predicted regulator of Ras-like GTPase activity (Roadblock/LC7/MglB family)